MKLAACPSGDGFIRAIDRLRILKGVLNHKRCVHWACDIAELDVPLKIKRGRIKPGVIHE